MNFDKEILDIQKKRIKGGKEPNIERGLIGNMPRITLAITRHPAFKIIKEEIIQSELKDERFLP